MEAKEQEVRYYNISVSKCPFLDWLNSLRDKRAQQRIDARLARVEAGLLETPKVLAKVYRSFASTMDLAIGCTLVVTATK